MQLRQLLFDLCILNVRFSCNYSNFMAVVSHVPCLFQHGSYTFRNFAAGDYGHNIGNVLFSCSAAIWYCSIACNSFRLCFPFATGHNSSTGLVTVPTCPFVTLTFQFMQRSTDKHLISKPFMCEAWLFNALFNSSIANTLF